MFAPLNNKGRLAAISHHAHVSCADRILMTKPLFYSVAWRLRGVEPLVRKTDTDSHPE